MVYELNETPIVIYRLLDKDGHVTGYTLDILYPEHKERFQGLTGKDVVKQIQVHLFRSLREAWAFREGLVLAGEPEAEIYHLEYGWAVLRLLDNPPEDPEEPDVKIIDCTDRVY
ncbi:MAG TPA: hypothetical protein ENJ91_10755 [Rhodobacteraceae bacterium]|nr:hypothetical protein [Paracoccaceae bacterium]